MEKHVKLVVVAADAGFQHSINVGIMRGCEEGIITCASFIVGGQWFHEMARFARENTDLTVGIHLALAGGLHPYPLRPVSPANMVPSLVDGQGFLFDSSEELESRNTPIYEDIYREFRAQVELAYKEGLDVAYLDNHVSLNPDAAKALQDLADEFVLPIKRRSGETDVGDVYYTPCAEKPAKVAELIDACTTGPGTYLYRCHPGWNTPEARAVTAGNSVYTGIEWALHREAEARVVRSDEVREVIERKGIQLTGHYRERRDELRSKMTPSARTELLARIGSLRELKYPDPGTAFVWDKPPAVVARTAGPVRVDGDLQEFTAAPPLRLDAADGKGVIALGKPGEGDVSDLSGEVRLMHDAENLYIGLRAWDTTPFCNDNRLYELHKGDCLEVFLCSDPELAYRRRGNVKKNEADRKLTLAPTSDVGRPAVVCDSGEAPGCLAEIVAVKLPDGYTMEARVSLSLLGGESWQPGDRLRFEVALTDADEDGRGKTKLYWNAETRRGWSDPDLWGIAELE